MLSLFFVSHLPESFTPKFDELFQLAEVIAMEFAYANGEREQEDFWNAVSRGSVLPPASSLSNFEEFTKGLLERLFCTDKLVRIERSPAKRTEDEQMNSLHLEARRLWRQKRVEDAIQGLRKWQKEFTLQIQRRDISYAQQLQNLVTKSADKRLFCVRGLLHRECLSR